MCALLCARLVGCQAIRSVGCDSVRGSVCAGLCMLIAASGHACTRTAVCLPHPLPPAPPCRAPQLAFFLLIQFLLRRYFPPGEPRVCQACLEQPVMLKSCYSHGLQNFITLCHGILSYESANFVMLLFCHWLIAYLLSHVSCVMFFRESG